MIVVIVAFFVAAALLVRVLGRVTEEASVERESEIAEVADEGSGQQHGLLPGQHR